MKKMKFLKGSPLFALARSKARPAGIDPAGLKLDQLIHAIQAQEGHESCFKKKKNCGHPDCCWQASCGARMVD